MFIIIFLITIAILTLLFQYSGIDIVYEKLHSKVIFAILSTIVFISLFLSMCFIKLLIFNNNLEFVTYKINNKYYTVEYNIDDEQFLNNIELQGVSNTPEQSVSNYIKAVKLKEEYKDSLKVLKGFNNNKPYKK